MALAASTDRHRPAAVTTPVGTRWTVAHDSRRALQLAGLLIRWFTVPLLQYLVGRPLSNVALGVRLRTVFERMGITYTKIGQFLAMRFDVLPPEICRELGQLFEAAPPLPFGVVRAITEAELGAPLDARFSSFATQPIASASVAQVHRATTKDGEDVAVKVQRPGIAAVLASDMRNLRRLAAVVDALGLSGRISTVSLVDEIHASTLREMDFIREARSADRLRRESRGQNGVPRIRRDLTTSRVLTMEYIEGISLLRIQQLIHVGRRDEVDRLLPGINWSRVGTRLTHACMHQLVVSGFFHGDPHPGNVLIRPDGRVALVDFGIVGELTRDDRLLMRQYLANTVGGNIAEAWRAWLRLAPPTADTDMIGYRREGLQILATWHDAFTNPRRGKRIRHIGYYQNQIIDTLRRYHVPLPPDHLLFWRVLLVLDVMALEPPLRLDLAPILRRFFARLEGSAIERAASTMAGVADAQARLEWLAEAPIAVGTLVADVAIGRRTWRGTGRTARGRSWLSSVEALSSVAASLGVIAAAAALGPTLSAALSAVVSACLLLIAISVARRRLGQRWW